MKTNHKRLKAVLVSEIKKLSPVFLVWNLGEFSLFNGFLNSMNFLFFDLRNLDNFLHFDFWDFDNFLLFDFIDFLINSLLSSIH